MTPHFSSFDVFVEGKNVPRLGDQMIGNEGGAANTPPGAEMQPPAVAAGGDFDKDPDALHIIFVDPAGNPVPDVKYVLRKPDGVKIEGKTDKSGEINIKCTIVGIGRIYFPDYPGSSINLID